MTYNLVNIFSILAVNRGHAMLLILGLDLKAKICGLGLGL